MDNITTVVLFSFLLLLSLIESFNRTSVLREELKLCEKRCELLLEKEGRLKSQLEDDGDRYIKVKFDRLLDLLEKEDTIYKIMDKLGVHDESQED